MKRDLYFKNQSSWQKKEKYEPLCVSKLLFWHQKWVVGAWLGAVSAFFLLHFFNVHIMNVNYAKF